MDNLKDKKIQELRTIAKELGLPVTRESAQALRTRIILHMQPGLMDELNKNDRVEPKPKEATKWLTTQEVMDALSPFKDKIKLAFYDENNEPTMVNPKTWHVKNGPAEDSGTMSISLKWLKIKAGEIANARFPAKVTRSGTELDGALGA